MTQWKQNMFEQSVENKAQESPLSRLLNQKRLAEAYLFLVPDFYPVNDVIRQWISTVFCKQAKDQACEVCQSCQLVASHQHPDLHWLLPEKEGGNIKVEQIRQLQQSIYTGSHLASHRFYIIPAVDNLNAASSNALLKILEEPPEHCHFILLASQLLTVLPTIISRCHKVYFPQPRRFVELLEQGQSIAEKSSRALILEISPSMTQDLLKLSKKEISVIEVAERLKTWPVDDLLWLFYGLFSQINQCIISNKEPSGILEKELSILKDSADCRKLLDLLAKITILRKKFAKNINLNALLVIEDILIRWVQIYE